MLAFIRILKKNQYKTNMLNILLGCDCYDLMTKLDHMKPKNLAPSFKPKIDIILIGI